MRTGEIAFCRLNRRGDLDTVDIAGLNLRLHEKIQNTVDLSDNDPEIPDLRLKDHRLFFDEMIVHEQSHALDGKKAPLPVQDLAVIIIIKPEVAVINAGALH